MNEKQKQRIRKLEKYKKAMSDVFGGPGSGRTAGDGSGSDQGTPAEGMGKLADEVEKYKNSMSNVLKKEGVSKRNDLSEAGKKRIRLFTDKSLGERGRPR